MDQTYPNNSKKEFDEQQNFSNGNQQGQNRQEEIEALKKERDRYINDFQKARAELINYKKEEEERLREVIKFANEKIMKELITVLDSFDLAIESLEGEGVKEEKEKYLKGIYLIKNQLEDLMKKEGLEEIVVEKGTNPDLTKEEIVAEVETDKFPVGTVAEIFQKGYLFNGKLIRPARVAVVKQLNN